MKNNPNQQLSESFRVQLIQGNNVFQMSCMKTDLTKPTEIEIQNIQKNTNSIKIIDHREKISDYQVSSQNERRSSTGSSHVKKYTKNRATQQIKKPITDIKTNYDVWDLTYTLIQSKMKIYASATWFFTFLAIRVYTICCCIYISTNSVHIQWLIPFILVRVVFFILVLKISLNDPTTKTEIVLKTHWNSIQNDTKQYFQVMSFQKLGTSILRGLCPAQLSFIYIKSQQLKRKYEIFTAINFIFVSIEQIVFYPFFIGYCSDLMQKKQFSIDPRFQIATIFIASGGLVVFVVLTIYLFILGVKNKYGKIRYWFNHRRYKMKTNKFDYQEVNTHIMLTT